MFCEIPDFGRCCFCLPLRRGVLVFGYINVLFSAFMVGMYSYAFNEFARQDFTLVYKGVTSDSVAEVCIALYCIEVIVNCLLVFGAHGKKILFMKIFYYYSVTTTLAALVLQIVEFSTMDHFGRVFEMTIFAFTGLCIQVYLIFLVRSLLKKLEMGEDHSYDNQLHLIVTGDAKVENGVYNNTTVAPAGDV